MACGNGYWVFLRSCEGTSRERLARVSPKCDRQLIKTENRLCRNLAGTELTGTINRWTCWEGAGEVDDETVLAIDLGDVRKPNAKKMEYLGGIRDGSTGEIGKGYWLCEVIAAHPYGEKIVSENDQLLKEVRRSVPLSQTGLQPGGHARAELHCASQHLCIGACHSLLRQRGNRRESEDEPDLQEGLREGEAILRSGHVLSVRRGRRHPSFAFRLADWAANSSVAETRQPTRPRFPPAAAVTVMGKLLDSTA